MPAPEAANSAFAGIADDVAAHRKHDACFLDGTDRLID